MRKAVLWGALAVILLLGASYGSRAYLVQKARVPILATLNDPDSAKFRNERFIGPWFAGGILCGEVNAKNRMGGYVGYVSFYSIVDGATPVDSLIGMKDGREFMADFVQSFCDDVREDAKMWWLRW